MADNCRIPRIIHQTWADTNIPTRIFKKEWTDSWKTNNSKCMHKLWTDNDIRNLVKTHYQWFLDKYDNIYSKKSRPEHGRRLADIGRYMILHRYGGVYTDLDTYCLKEVFPIFTKEMCYIPVEPKLTPANHSNCFMASNPGNPFLSYLIKTIDEENATRMETVQATGPRFLDRVIPKFNERNSLVILEEDTVQWCNEDVDSVVQLAEKSELIGTTVTFSSWGKTNNAQITDKSYLLHFSASYKYP